MHLARLVRAVLAPHHAENAHLRYIRLATQNLLHARVFFARQAVLRRDFRRYLDFSECRGHSLVLYEEASRGNPQTCILRQSGAAARHAVAFAAPTSASIIERKITNPSCESSADSTARSG